LQRTKWAVLTGHQEGRETTCAAMIFCPFRRSEKCYSAPRCTPRCWFRGANRARKRRILRRAFMMPGFARGDSMSDIQTDLKRPVPSIVPSDIPAMSDDECLIRLAQAVEAHDSAHLDEVARLIGRLAVTIE